MLWQFINKVITEVVYTRKDVTGCQVAFQVPILQDMLVLCFMMPYRPRLTETYQFIYSIIIMLVISAPA